MRLRNVRGSSEIIEKCLYVIKNPTRVARPAIRPNGLPAQARPL